MYTNIHLTKELQSELQFLFKTYKNLRESAAMTLTSVPDGALVHTNFQTIFRLRHTSKLQVALHQHVMLHAVKAETIVPGGFDNCLRILLEQKYDVAPYSSDQSILRHPLPTLSDIDELVKRYVPKTAPQHIPGMITDAIDLAGFGGKIIIEKTNNRPSIEHVSGYSFPLIPAIQTSHGNSLFDPRIICIDGFIESVAEAHSLFEQAASTEQICLLFARGMSDDVKHTIKVNFDRGKMKVIPFIVRFDFDGINTLVDLATIAGNDVVSSHRGDLISAINLSDHRSVERVDVTPKGIIIYNKQTRATVAKHVSRLSEKRIDVNEHLADMLEQRIRTLVNNTVFIRLPDDMNYVISSQAIDYALRAVRSAMSYGIIIGDDGRPIPSIVEPVSRHFAHHCLQSLNQLGAVITSEDQPKPTP